MRVNERRAACGLILLAVGAVACGADDVTDDPVVVEPLTLFRDPTTSGPRLDVYDVDGHTAVSVSGPIGSEGMLAGMDSGGSLAKLYRAVHPSAGTIPAELMRLDERIAPELAALRSATRPPADAAPATIEKSESGFNATLCKTLYDGNVRFTARECRWSNQGTGVGVAYFSTNKILAGDRTYGWNANAYPSTISWYYDIGGRWQRHTIQLQLPAYWWNWMSIYSGGPFHAGLVGNQFVWAERGLTWHAWDPLVR